MKFEEQIEDLKRLIEQDAELVQQSRAVMEDLDRRLHSGGDSSHSGAQNAPENDGKR